MNRVLRVLADQRLSGGLVFVVALGWTVAAGLAVSLFRPARTNPLAPTSLRVTPAGSRPAPPPISELDPARLATARQSIADAIFSALRYEGYSGARLETLTASQSDVVPGGVRAEWRVAWRGRSDTRCADLPLDADGNIRADMLPRFTAWAKSLPWGTR